MKGIQKRVVKSLGVQLSADYLSFIQQYESKLTADPVAEESWVSELGNMDFVIGTTLALRSQHPKFATHNIMVIVFKDEQKAEELKLKLLDLQCYDAIDLEDVVVLVREVNGEIKINGKVLVTSLSSEMEALLQKILDAQAGETKP